MSSNSVYNFRWVYRELLAGSAYPKRSEEVEWLSYSQNITNIISFEPIDDLRDVMGTIKLLRICHQDILFNDGEEPTREQADLFVKITDECLAGNLPLLCHCKAGRGRTGTMLVYYLMTRFGYTLDQGFDAISNTVQERDQINFLYVYARELEATRNKAETFTAELAREYKSLKLDQDRAMIFWSGPMAIRGIRAASDVDVLVTDDYYEELLKVYPDCETKPGKIAVGKVGICRGDARLCESVDEAMEHSQIIQGMNFMALPDVTRLKMHRRSPKDFADIVMIQDYLYKTSIT